MPPKSRTAATESPVQSSAGSGGPAHVAKSVGRKTPKLATRATPRKPTTARTRADTDLPRGFYRKEAAAARRRRFLAIDAELKRLYPNADTALIHRNPFELLVATILSAQCTDVLVNKVTPALFAAYPTAAALALATAADVHALIARVNYAPSKARHLVAAAKLLAGEFGGQVPETMAELIRLPGVGRKTANVVLGNAFHQSVGIVVDTHVRRLSQRLALSINAAPPAIEADLMAFVPKADWTGLSHRLILHGRSTCKARHPGCESCPLNELCPSRPTK